MDMRLRNTASAVRCCSPRTRIKARRLRAANQTPAHPTPYISASWTVTPHALGMARRRARQPGTGAGLLIHHILTTLIPPPRASHYHTTRTRIFLIMDIEHCPPMPHHKHAARRRVRRVDLPRPTPTTTLRRACSPTPRRTVPHTVVTFTRRLLFNDLLFGRKRSRQRRRAISGEIIPPITATESGIRKRVMPASISMPWYYTYNRAFVSRPNVRCGLPSYARSCVARYESFEANRVYIGHPSRWGRARVGIYSHIYRTAKT